MSNRATILAALAVVLVLIALVSFAVGQHLFAGLCFLLVTMTIYLREKGT